MRVISVFNQKGGVGKTTTVVNLAVALKDLGKNVLVIDIDPQSNTTTGLGQDKYKIDKSLYDLFYAEGQQEVEASEIDQNDTEKVEYTSQEDESDISKEHKEAVSEEKDSIEKLAETKVSKVDINDYITKTKSGVDLIASESALSGLEVELVDLDPIDRTRELKKIIDLLGVNNYDFVLIDCPPSLGLLSINALVASNSIIIPIQTEYYALEGVIELMNTYDMVSKELNKDLEIEGVLLSMFDKRASLSYEVVEEVKSYFKTDVFKVMIPRNPSLAEAPSHGLSTIEYDNDSKGAFAYKALAKELIQKQENRKGA